MKHRNSAAKILWRWTWRAVIVVMLGLVTNTGVVVWIAFASAEAPVTHHARWRLGEAEILGMRGRSAFMTSYYEMRWMLDDPDAQPLNIGELIIDLRAQSWSSDRITPMIRSGPSPISIAQVMTDSIGWPFRSAAAGSWVEPTTNRPIATFGGFEIGSRSLVFPGSPRHLPLTPMWDGLLANVAIYGLLWFVLVFGWRDIRQVLRAKRGRCPRCGYDLRGEFESGCTECGWNRADRSVV